MTSLAVIGPVLPYRGGIAQHTTMLCRALTNRCQTRIYSFSRQYPKWLFPGESDRDPSFIDHREPSTDYCLDAINPLSWKKLATRLSAERPDAVLIPWWTFFLGPCFRFLAGQMRKAGIPVIFLCHNVMDHEASAWKNAVTRAVLRQGSGFVVHTRTEREMLLQMLSTSRVTVHPMPFFDQFPSPTEQLLRRTTHELLFFGFVRQYKGLDILFQALSRLGRNDVILTVAGEFWGGDTPYRRLAHDLGIERLVDFQPRYHTDQEAARLFARADIVVLPYRNATGSGVVPVACHYGKPVIASRVGGLPDAVIDGATGILVPAEDPDGLARAIETALASDWPGLESGLRELRRRLSWNSLATDVLRIAADVQNPR
jgi:glycosyltransferase involved in cell wall biosynthesis